ncbi:MAG TPA: hypothetical protein VF188_07615 [Longimicrobiales bacterium]
MYRPEEPPEAPRRRSAPEREAPGKARRAFGHEWAGPLRRIEQRRTWPVRPLTPEDLAGGIMDKPSQAEGARETVEEDLRIQEERQAVRRAGRSRGGA